MTFGGFRLRTLNFSAFGWRLSLRHEAAVGVGEAVKISSLSGWDFH